MEFGPDLSKGIAAYNRLVEPSAQIKDNTLPPSCRGQLQARGLTNNDENLAKLFSRLLVATAALHISTGGDSTDIILFVANSNTAAAWVSDIGLKALRQAAVEIDEKQLRQVPASRERAEPHWDTMTIMKRLGFVTGTEGMPLFDLSSTSRGVVPPTTLPQSSKLNSPTFYQICCTTYLTALSTAAM